MKAILSVDLDYGIGKNGGLLVRIPEDMKRFKRITLGGTVVMGRKTYESLPGKKPLPGRENIILSKTLGQADGFTVLNSISELLSFLSEYDTDKVFVIGGGEIYRLLLPYCSDVYLTVIEHRLGADTFLPRICESGEWVKQGSSASFCHDLIKYHFEDFKRI